MRALLPLHALLCLLLAIVQSKKEGLQKYNIQDVTVSGLSSGAYFAVQFHVAHSRLVNGSAIFAGGPWYCAESNLETATQKCMATNLGKPDTQTLVALTYTDSSLGLIDSPSNMEGSRVYLFSGKDDSVVESSVVHSLQSYYTAFVSPNNLVADFNVAAEHCMPTVNFGEDCSTLASPYLGKCGFDGAGAAFKYMYPQLDLERSEPVSANLFSFDQTSYFSSSVASIGDVGYIYVPTNCQSGQTPCHLHVSFHGCEQNLELVGNVYAEHAGYNYWAEKNDIIVLYPYVKVGKVYPYNPKGCWDWWAYTGLDYGVQSGVQMRFVRAMLEAMGV